MDESLEQQWKDVIIDHNQFPRRHGTLENASHQARGENPFCGDKVSLQLELGPEGQLTDVAFEATGCAISLSSASLLADSLSGRTIQEATSLFHTVHELLTSSADQRQPDLGEIEALALIKRYPARVKCATLVWHVLRNALEGGNEVATTE